MTTNSDDDRAQYIFDRLLAHQPWNVFTMEAERHEWFYRMMSDFVLGSRGDEIVYVTSQIDYAEDDSFSGVVVVFTTRRVLRATINGELDRVSGVERATAPVVVRARSGLSALTPSAGIAYGYETAYQTWPGQLYVELTYAGEVTLTIPLRDQLDRQGRTETVAFLPSLLEDLH